MVRGIKGRDYELSVLACGSRGRVAAATSSRRECDRGQHSTSKETRRQRRRKRRTEMRMRQARLDWASVLSPDGPPGGRLLRRRSAAAAD